MPNWTSQPKLLPRCNFIQTCFKKYDGLMMKKQNCLLCQNLRASKSAHRLLWRLAKFGQYAKFGKFMKLGVAHILRYLLTDLLPIQAKLVLEQKKAECSKNEQQRGLSCLMWCRSIFVTSSSRLFYELTHIKLKSRVENGSQQIELTRWRDTLKLAIQRVEGIHTYRQTYK